MIALFLSFACSAKIGTDPISSRYLAQLREVPSPSKAEQAVIWGIAELGFLLEKTVTQAEVERDLSHQIRDILEKVEVASKMMVREGHAMIRDVELTTERVINGTESARFQVHEMIEGLRDQVLEDVNEMMELIYASTGYVDHKVLKRIRKEVKRSVESDSQWSHHIMFAAFQIILIAGIVYYSKLMNALAHHC